MGLPPSTETREQLQGMPFDARSAKACQLAEGLFPHQIEGVAFLLARRRAILADDMGLGKTRQAIIALREAARRAALVVCPASVKLNWPRESCRRARADVAIVRRRPLGGRARWTVVNYDLLSRHATPWKPSPGPG